MTTKKIQEALHQSDLRTLLQIAIRAKGLNELPIAVGPVTLESSATGILMVDWKSEAPDIITLDIEVKLAQDNAKFSAFHELISNEDRVISYLRGSTTMHGCDIETVYAETRELLLRAVTAFVMN